MSYTIKEISGLLGVNEKTCLRWIEIGLQTIPDSKKPILIYGEDLKEFLRIKSSKRKVKLNRSQYYCLSCKAARYAKRGSTEILKGRKIALCRVCNGKIARIFKPSQKDYQIPLFTV